MDEIKKILTEQLELLHEKSKTCEEKYLYDYTAGMARIAEVFAIRQASSYPVSRILQKLRLWLSQLLRLNRR